MLGNSFAPPTQAGELDPPIGHEAIDAVLARGFTQAVATGARMARVAGHLLAIVGAGSEMVIDALAVATAIRFGGGVIATHDPDDLRRLAAGHPNVAILKI